MSLPSEGARPLARIALGALRGVTDATADDGTAAAPVHAFLGIPFAQPPMGPLRWQGPRPPQAWDGERDASRFGPDCTQAANPRLRGDGMGEDCLYLNVWTPAGATGDTQARLPVMVWVHGGGFVGGSGSDVRTYGADMARQGVVLVSFNYRPGLFGFLAHPALSAESAQGVSGNYGLLDQLAALGWVRDHIAAFGGDPSRVTVFGVSAGSASISLLLGCAHARGLFQQAILHSPGAGRPLASLEDATRAGSALGSDIAELRRLDAASLFARTSELNPKVRGLTTPRLLRPIQDGWLIPKDERAALLAGHFNAMPMIVGSNTDEGTLLTREWPLSKLADYTALMQNNFGPKSPEAIRLYPAVNDSQARPAIAALFGDTQFNYGVRLLARAMSARNQPVWRYLFNRRRPEQTDGPHHGDEVAHVFGTLQRTFGISAGNNQPNFDEADRSLSRQMMGAWARFATTGNPNGPGLADWPAYEPAADNYRMMDWPLGQGSRWRETELDFLDRYFDAQA